MKHVKILKTLLFSGLFICCSVVCFAGVKLHRASSPCYSPDGTRIVFAGLKDGKSHIFMINRSGYNLKQLTYSAYRDFSPCYSPDGNRIAFISTDSASEPGEIWMMAPSGVGLEQLTINDYFEGSPTFSPDGRKLVFVRSQTLTRTPSGRLRWAPYGVYTVNVTGAGDEQVGDETYKVIRRPWFMPGTDQLLLSIVDPVQDKYFNSKYPAGTVALSSIEDGLLTPLGKNGASYASPSRDGSRIVYVDWAAGSSNSQEVFVMNANGTGAKQLTHGMRRVADPVFSPDGQTVMFVGTKGASRTWNLFEIGIDDGVLKAIDIKS